MKLEEVCEFIIDAEHKTAPFQKEGYPNIRTPNIGKGRLILDGVFRVSEETYRGWTKRAVPQPNDLILAREAPVGNVAIIPENELVCLGQRTVLLRPDTHKTNPHFLCYFLLSDRMQNLMLGKSGGSTVAHLNMKDIRALELGELPPLPTQQKIASILSAYDDLIENNLKRILLLEEAAQHLYREWFVRFRFPGWEEVKVEDGLPEGWERVNLNTVFSVKYGKNLSTDKITKAGKHPVYGASGKMGYFESSNLNMKTALVTSRGNGSGDVHRTFENEAFVTNNSFIVTPNAGFDHIPFFFVMELLKSLNLKSYCSGSAQPQLTNSALTQIELILPSKNMIEQYSNKCTSFFDLTDSLLIQNQKLKEARDILLPRLMNQTIEI